MNKLIRVPAVLMLLSAGGCAQTRVVNTAQVYDPVASLQEYTQRADAVTLSAGNAQEVNSRIQVIDPWPRYAGNTRITANGQRMAGAIERYRDVSKLRQAPAPLPLQATSSVTSGGSAPATAGQ